MKKMLKKGGSNIPELQPHTHTFTHKHSKIGYLVKKYTNLFFSKYFKTLIIIIIIAGLSVGGYFLYRNIKLRKDSLFSSSMLLDSLHNSKTSKLILNNEFPTATSSNEYNISMWIYIKDYNYRKNVDKCILFRGFLDKKLGDITDPEIDNCNPSIWLLANTNTMRIYTGLDTSFKPGVKKDFCEIKYVPLQKWVHLNICLRNNIFDVYIDGKLHKTTILSGAPRVSAGDLHICNESMIDNLSGFDGFISKIEYANLAISPKNIYKIYKKGPNIEKKTDILQKIKDFFSR